MTIQRVRRTYRYTEGQYDRLPELATELVRFQIG